VQRNVSMGFGHEMEEISVTGQCRTSADRVVGVD